jgi:hypothetical protein
MLYYNWILNINDKKLHENTAEASEYIIRDTLLVGGATPKKHSKIFQSYFKMSRIMTIIVIIIIINLTKAQIDMGWYKADDIYTPLVHIT